MNANIIEKANQIITGCEAAYFGVIDKDGFPSVSTVSPVNPESILELCFTTHTDGNKGKRLQDRDHFLQDSSARNVERRRLHQRVTEPPSDASILLRSEGNFHTA